MLDIQPDQALFQSTLPLRGATGRNAGNHQFPCISIHAPLAGSDLRQLFADVLHDISIHAPLAGSDRRIRPADPFPSLFQSTLPLRGATLNLPLAERICRFQSTLPLRGATSMSSTLIGMTHYFNPRSPCGERLGLALTVRVLSNFNPRSPCGERRFDHALSLPSRLFQSTLPLRGATHRLLGILRGRHISIHAPLAGSDPKRHGKPEYRVYFNPRSPCGERPS